MWNTIKYYLGYDQTSQFQQQLQDKIIELQNQMDKDRNNIVTKDELSSYFMKLMDNNNDGIITHSELESYVQNQINKQNNETEKWKLEYEKLREKYEILLDNISHSSNHQVNNNESRVNDVSTQALVDYIESEIMNTDANLRFVPDPIERRIYLTVYKTIMKSLEGLFNTTSIDLLNHRITLNIQPKKENKEQKGNIENTNKEINTYEKRNSEIITL